MVASLGVHEGGYHMIRSLLGGLVLVAAGLALSAPVCPTCRNSSAVIEARLKANGFDPKDPNLATKLRHSHINRLPAFDQPSQQSSPCQQFRTGLLWNRLPLGRRLNQTALPTRA